MSKIQYKDPETDEIITIEINASMPVITIGRNPGNVIRVNNPSISRQHAKIIWEEGVCSLNDLGSSNGSYINGQAVKSQVLKIDDRIRVGEFPLDFFSDDGPRSIEFPNEGENAHFDEMSIPEVNALDAIEIKSPSLMDASAINKESRDGEDQLSPIVFSGVEPAGSMNPISFLESEFSDIASSIPEPAGVEISAPLPVMELAPIEISEMDVIAVSDDIVDENISIGEIEPLVEISEKRVSNNSEASAAKLSPVESSLVESSLAESSLVESSLAESSLAESSAAKSSPVISLEAPSASLGIASQEFEARIEELTSERDELLDLLQSRAGDAGGAAKVQIDRLRKERDRLIEERRGLQRSQRKLKENLAAFPPIEDIKTQHAELVGLREKDTQHEEVVTSLQVNINDRDSELDALAIQLKERENKIHEFEKLLAEDADLHQAFENAQNEIENFTEKKLELENKISMLSQAQENAESVEKEFREKLEKEEVEGKAKTLRITNLETEKEELLQKATELASLKEEFQALQAALDARPLPDEVEEIVATLASAQVDNEKYKLEVSELRKTQHALESSLNTANIAQSEFDSRFGIQTKELDNARQNFIELKKEKEAFARETDYLVSAKRNFDSEIRSHEKRVQELEKSDRRKKKIFNELRTDLEALVGENTILQSEIAALKNALDEAPSESELTSALDVAAGNIEEITSLKLTISDIEKELDKLSKALTVESALKEKLETMLNDASVELDALRLVVAEGSDAFDEMSGLKKEIVKLEKEIVKLEKEIKSLTKNLEKISSALEKKTQAFNTQKEEVKKLKKIASSKSKNSETGKSEKEIKQLKQELVDIENALAEVILEKDKLEDELNSTK